MSVDMTPRLPNDRSPSGIRGAAKHQSKLGIGNVAGRVQTPYLSNDILSNDCTPMPLSRRGTTPSNSIRDVVCVGSCNQMRWITAWGIVARVPNYKPIRHWTVRKLIGYVTNHSHLTINHNLTVTRVKTGCEPRPTFTRTSFVDLGPEPFPPSKHSYFVRTCPTARVGAPSQLISRLTVKQGIANVTYCIWAHHAYYRIGLFSL